jgi:geranyl-CoA carboxylase alpha subunit
VVAVKAVQALHYEGAGTLEFLLDADRHFYFMEMNTRLQVEHPVTEAITGLDLVELQLRVAAGEPLPLRQQDVTFTGHAIEARLCAEDAAHGFMPRSGVMSRWDMPDGLRVEHALQSGSDIPPHYDSMIAKLVGHGTTRDEARARLICGLEQAIAFGVTTSQAFLISCLRHPAFVRGEATTAFIDTHRAGLLTQNAALPTDIALSALLLHLSHPHAWPWRGGRSLAAGFPAPLRFQLGETMHECDVLRERDGCYVVGHQGATFRFELDELGGGMVRFRHGDVMDVARFHRAGDQLWLQRRDLVWAVRDLTLTSPEAAATSRGDGKVRAALNGRVVAILVEPGAPVAAGQPVLTLEAMKMEHVHSAGIAGVVSAVDVVEGEQVTAGRIVVEIAAA